MPPFEAEGRQDLAVAKIIDPRGANASSTICPAVQRTDDPNGVDIVGSLQTIKCRCANCRFMEPVELAPARFFQAMNTPLRVISSKLPTGAPVLGAGDTNERRVGTKLSFTSGQTLFLAGDPAERIYEVLDGVLMVFKVLSDGRRQIAEILPAGWLGGFATEGHYDCSCEALTNATVIAYTRVELDRSQILGNRLQHQAEEQLCALHEQTLNLGRKDAEERLATFLMRFIPGRGRLGCVGPKHLDDDARVHVPMSRAEMADYLGLTIETVSRIITVLVHKGLVRVGPKRGDIYVNDVCKLCAIARTGHNE